jgi:hypothetical protein
VVRETQPPPATVTSDDETVRYHVQDAGLHISTPVDWTSGTGLDGALIVFMAPHPPGTPFHSNLTIITRPRDAADAHADQVAEQARALGELGDALLLESEPATVGGRPAARALVAYNNGEFELTLEQWVVASAKTVVVISATVLTFDYALDAGLYEAIVGSVVFDDG